VQEDRLRTEALLYFQQGSKSARPGGPTTLAEQQPLEPALASLRTSLLQQEHRLKQQASDLNRCLEVGTDSQYGFPAHFSCAVVQH
jgi:hypothetical protein